MRWWMIAVWLFGVLGAGAALVAQSGPARGAEGSVRGELARAAAADALFAKGDWAGAEAAYAALAEGNPDQGLYWYRLGACRGRLRQIDGLIECLMKCSELGYEHAGTMEYLGMCWRAMGDADRAAEWYERLVDADPGAVDRLNSERGRAMLGAELSDRLFGTAPPEGAPREERWRFDLEFLARVLRRGHFDPYTKAAREEWDARIGALHAAIPGLTDKEAALELMRLAALAGDGHTCMWPMYRKELGFHQLPVLLYPFADGWFVRAADAAHDGLVGARVMAVGGVPIEEVFARASGYIGHENAMHAKLCGPSLVGTVEILRAVGAAASDERVTLTVDRGSGADEVEVVGVAWDPALYGDRDGAPQWRSMNSGAPAPLPAYLRDPENPYWYEYLAEERVLYFYYGNVFEKEDEPFGAFLDGMFGFMATHPVDALVIDLRANFGGSTELYAPLIRRLISHAEINRNGKLFTVIGRQTYSAAMNLAVDLEYWTETVFVGEPTGASVNFIGENRLFTLPCSGLRVSVSDRYHQHGASDSTDKRVWIAPDIAAGLTSEMFSANRDPAMEAILGEVRARGE